MIEVLVSCGVNGKVAKHLFRDNRNGKSECLKFLTQLRETRTRDLWYRKQNIQKIKESIKVTKGKKMYQLESLLHTEQVFIDTHEIMFGEILKPAKMKIEIISSN